jgi:5-dehydro-4-deoxyglucarate dehydratase
MALSVADIRNALSDGLLSFPVTDFDASGRFNPDSYRERIEWFLEHDISAIFVAGGTGEFFSLVYEEFEQIVSIAVEVAGGKVPVIASAGRSISDARKYCAAAEAAGADGILLMPPFLTECPEEGTVQYAKAIMEASSLQFIYYNRGNGILSAPSVEALAKACPNLIGLKDGTGNIQQLNDIIRTVGDRLVYVGGVPTAEILAEAYLSIGVNTYSSAAFNFVPDLANRFYKALRAGDAETVDTITRDFYLPLVRMRERKKGYAVSLIKAGVDIIGRPAGKTRAPLTMPSAEEYDELKAIIGK